MIQVVQPGFAPYGHVINICNMDIFMRLAYRFFLVLTLIAFSFPSLAETRNVPAGRTSVVGFFYSYNSESCYYAGKPRFTVVDEPAHGRVASKWQSFRLGKDAGRCSGKVMYGMMISYTPEGGYRGPDKVKIGLTGSKYTIGSETKTDIIRINLNVR